MSFFEWLLTQRQHPRIGPFAIWAWSEHSPIPRTTRKLWQALAHLDDPAYAKWRESCKRAHKLYRDAQKVGERVA